MIDTELIAVARKDGGTSILAFVVRGRGHVLPEGASWVNEKEGIWSRPSRESLVADEVKRAVPDYLAWHRVSKADIPVDRTYRDAWHHDGKRLGHDMVKAREVHRRNVRHERARAMPELDAQWMRATGKGDKKAADAVEALRQKWRDAPADPRIEAAQTVEELKALKAV